MTRVAIAVEGWNAEAAVGFALAARKFASSVLLSSGRETVDGKDEIEVMTLGPEPGEEVLMAVDGRDEKDAFNALLARLLGVIETPKDTLAAVTGPGRVDQEKAAMPPRRYTAEVAALDVEEVAPVLPRRRPATSAWKPRKTSAARRKKRGRADRKPEPKARKKPTKTKRHPRPRKK